MHVLIQLDLYPPLLPLSAPLILSALWGCTVKQSILDAKSFFTGLFPPLQISPIFPLLFFFHEIHFNYALPSPLSLQVYYMLLNVRYGEEDDQVGLLRMLANNSFSSGFPLHEVQY